MSSDFHRPTYTLEGRTENGTVTAKPFNPSEVRLYGLHGAFPPILAAKKLDLIAQNYRITVDPAGKGAAATVSKASLIAIETKEADQVVFLVSGATKPDKPLEAGIIYAYAFEGHCYDLPKPKIMLIPAENEKPGLDDCGFDKKPHYKVWVVDKLDKCVEIEVNQGFVEQLVLEANLPGRRSPLTYRATSIASTHRSGRLSE